MGKLIFISGGINSGKSYFAEELCTKLGGRTLYIATSIAFDEEMKEKKERHIKRRSSKNWDTLECYSGIYSRMESINEKYDTVILDCVTMMVSNLIFENDVDFDASDKKNARKKELYIEEEVKKLIEKIRLYNINFIAVTNEIGLGGISENRLTRYFTSVCGNVNQLIAGESDEAYAVISGIPVKIK